MGQGHGEQAKHDVLIRVRPDVLKKLIDVGVNSEPVPVVTAVGGSANDVVIQVPSQVLASLYSAEVATFTKVRDGGAPSGGCISLPIYMSQAAVLSVPRSPRGTPVTLHVYDTFWITAIANLPAFHIGIEVLGAEFSFGDLGINTNDPGDYDPDRYRSSLSLGYTRLRDSELIRLLRLLYIEWPGEAYRLNGHNCQTFAVTLCDRLGFPPTAIPDEYLIFSEPWMMPWQLWGWTGLQDGKCRDMKRFVKDGTKLSL